MSHEDSTKIPIVIVAAMQKKDRAIGLGNDLLWHVPEDMKRFKELSTGHPIIMGRKTFESILSILGKPLPNRTNIVITRDTNYAHDGATVVHSLQEALETATSLNPSEIHIGGGAEIYKQVLPLVDRLHITWFSDDKTGDAFFPEFENDFEVAKEYPLANEGDITYQWVDYVRK